MIRDDLKAASLVLALSLAPLAAHAGTVRIYVTNSAGDSIHVVDPATNKVVQEIKGIEAAHGIAFSTDGAKVFVSNETDTTLDVFDRGSGKLIKKKLITVVDLATEQIAWELKLNLGVRPMTFDTNADGSTRRIFAQLSDLN